MEFNLAQLHEAVEAAVPDRECIVWRDRRLTYAEVGDRTRRLANRLLAAGFQVRSERAELEGHRSGQDHLALYLHNGNEYLEGMVGAFKARVAPFNVNYRYVAEELEYLLNDAGARGIVFHSAFAPTLDEVRHRVPSLELLLQVPDESGHPLLPGAEWYEDALAGSSPELPEGVRASWSPDDLYVLYTGGTTGMPKGVLWRQADIFVAALCGRRIDTGQEWGSLEEITENAATAGGGRVMPAPPFMHGAAHWMAFHAFHGGNTIVLPRNVTHLDPADVWRTVEAEGVLILLIVGDAFAKPLLDELEAGGHQPGLFLIVSGGAALSAPVKQRLLELLPNTMVMDGLGSSEAGQQASQMTAAGQEASTGTFTPGPGMCIVSEDMNRVLQAGDEEVGWLAQSGRVPLGYLGDAAKTARTFPVIDGTRYSIPGDRARVTGEGVLELFGRDSVTINSGGEKIFAEEVEQALAHHPDVFDVIVCGRPSDRWGNEVVAVVQLREGSSPSDEELLATAGEYVARYKLPKAIVRHDKLVRSPAGKADYRWAKEQALAASGA